nr:MAG TPA: hypothetical protein [Caudoviricetes sp.]
MNNRPSGQPPCLTGKDVSLKASPLSLVNRCLPR